MTLSLQQSDLPLGINDDEDKLQSWREAYHSPPPIWHDISTIPHNTFVLVCCKNYVPTVARRISPTEWEDTDGIITESHLWPLTHWTPLPPLTWVAQARATSHENLWCRTYL